MNFALPKSLGDLSQAKVRTVIGTALLVTAVLAAYAVMPSLFNGDPLLVVALQNLMGLAQ